VPRRDGAVGLTRSHPLARTNSWLRLPPAGAAILQRMTTLTPDLLRLLYAYDADRPLHGETRELNASDSLRVERFEYTSRHEERVAGLALSDPRASGPRPLILVAHPATLDKANDYVLWPAEQWVAQGAICATIDQAGHGERVGAPPSMEDFMRFPFRRLDQTVQTAVDWMRALDYLTARDDVDAERVGFVGFSMGGLRGAPFVGLDARVRAAVFCISGAARGGGGEGTEALAQAAMDPATFAPLMDRPTLVVAGRNDDVVPPEAAQRFHDAMPEPRALTWVECGHWDFMPQGLSPVWPWLEQHL